MNRRRGRANSGYGTAEGAVGRATPTRSSAEAPLSRHTSESALKYHGLVTLGRWIMRGKALSYDSSVLANVPTWDWPP